MGNGEEETASTVKCVGCGADINASLGSRCGGCQIDTHGGQK